MKTAFVLMTAMPPTTGHLQLVRFANRLAEHVTVIVCTQAFEPLPLQRVNALRQAVRRSDMKGVRIRHFSRTIPQDPKSPGFWDMWHGILTKYGLRAGDYIVASEPYGQKLAEITGAQFFPYDIDRSLNPAKATQVRNDAEAHYMDILPEFRPNITARITIFGAESTGKTTLSRQLAAALGAQWTFEYARPYLERTVNEITPRSMQAIWVGQKALQEQATDIAAHPCIVQDTDLFSTVGYWQFPHWQQSLGPCPEALIADAKHLQSDLYIITRSNIPFEPDPLRYGGDVREGSDEYWIELCERYELPFIVLDSADPDERIRTALDASRRCMRQKFAQLAYDRHGL